MSLWPSSPHSHSRFLSLSLSLSEEPSNLAAMASTKVQRIMTQPIVSSLLYFCFSVFVCFFPMFTHSFPFFVVWFLGVRAAPEPDFQVSSECKSLFLASGFALIWFFFNGSWSFCANFCSFLCFGWKLVQKARIQIWLFEQKDLRIEGRIIVSLCLTL